mgnify:CR=1 FL=1
MAEQKRVRLTVRKDLATLLAVDVFVLILLCETLDKSFLSIRRDRS